VLSQASIEEMAVAVARRIPGFPFADRLGASDPLDETLDREVNEYRDLIRAGAVRTALGLLHKLLDKLPAQASAKIKFRIKANIGHCYLQLDNKTEAIQWLSEASDIAPSEPNAVANKGLVFFIRDEFQRAFDLCRAALESNPDCEAAATYLLQAAVPLIEISEPFDVVPEILRRKPGVVLSRIYFLRGRDRHPDWWAYAREAASEFPDDARITFCAAESFVEEVIRSSEFQEHRSVPITLREPLSKAATILDQYWEQAHQTDTPNRADSLAALTDAMVAHQALGNFERAIALAREIVTRDHNEAALTNAFHVAQAFDDAELARAALDAIADPSPRIAFFRGMLCLGENQWNKAAAYLTGADVPETERVITNTIIKLAPLRDGKSAADVSEFRALIEATKNDPRSLVTIARIATYRGFVDVAKEAQSAAVASIGASITPMERAMVAAYSADVGDPTGAVDLMDNQLPLDHPSRELFLLATAHARESPSRERNLRFFENLPAPIRERPEYSRMYGSVLLNVGEASQASTIFRRTFQDRPSDTFAALRLFEALRQTGREHDIAGIVSAADEHKLEGPAEYRMVFAHELMRAGLSERALHYAYAVVREFPDNPQVAIGYFGLIVGRGDEMVIPDATAVGRDVWVKIRNGAGEIDSFVIDEGAQFLGINILGPQHAFVKSFAGLKVGESIEIPKPFNASEKWTVIELKSKYLQVLHVLMNEFERRFPQQGGFWRFTMKEGDITPILDMVKKRAEASRENAKLYLEKTFPLAFVARLSGGTATGFAQYLRGIGAEILTCLGALEERDAAVKIAKEYRGRGVVLDEYTAWVAAEIQILVILKNGSETFWCRDLSLSQSIN
jgi:tetratricopeptide (TPR) repeat protein